MSKPKTYRLTKISDLLTVPIERREDCVRDLLYGLALHELAFGDQAQEIGIDHVDWTDEGDNSVTLTDQDGIEVLSLKVVKDE